MRGHVLAWGAMAVFVALVSASSPGRAATVYRCGADGRTFSQAPCPSGEGRAVEVADDRDAGQRAEAREAARRTAAAADGLADARERSEAQRARAPGIIPVTRLGEAEERKAGKAVRKKKGRVGDDGLTVPFKGGTPDETATQKAKASR